MGVSLDHPFLAPFSLFFSYSRFQRGGACPHCGAVSWSSCAKPVLPWVDAFHLPQGLQT